MGLLFVLEGDKKAKEESFDLGIEDHSLLIKKSIQNLKREFPLVRRTNNYYGDVLFELDEMQSFKIELEILNTSDDMAFINKLLSLCEIAIK